MDIPKGGDRALILAAAALFCFALYSLVNYRPAYEGSGGLVSIGTITTSAPLRRRHAGSLAWSEIEGEGQIFLRDLVYTPPRVKAEVQLEDGRRMLLPPDSLVQFDDITVRNLEITLHELAKPKEEQAFRLLPLPKTKRAMPLMDPGYLEVAQKELLKKKLAVYAHRPILYSLKRKPVPPSELDSVQQYVTKLSYPEAGINLPFKKGSLTKVGWTPTPVKGVRYTIEFSLKENFENSIPFPAKTNSAEVTLDKPGKYFWHVISFGPGGVVKSDVRRFSLYPRGSRTVSESVSLQDLDRYQVEVSKNKTFDTLLTTIGSAVPACSPVGLAPGVYWCRVREGRGKQYTVKIFSFEVKK